MSDGLDYSNVGGFADVIADLGIKREDEASRGPATAPAVAPKPEPEDPRLLPYKDMELKDIPRDVDLSIFKHEVVVEIRKAWHRVDFLARVLTPDAIEMLHSISKYVHGYYKNFTQPAKLRMINQRYGRQLRRVLGPDGMNIFIEILPDRFDIMPIQRKSGGFLLVPQSESNQWYVRIMDE